MLPGARNARSWVSPHCRAPCLAPSVIGVTSATYVGSGRPAAEKSAVVPLSPERWKSRPGSAADAAANDAPARARKRGRFFMGGGESARAAERIARQSVTKKWHGRNAACHRKRLVAADVRLEGREKSA